MSNELRKMREEVDIGSGVTSSSSSSSSLRNYVATMDIEKRLEEMRSNKKVEGTREDLFSRKYPPEKVNNNKNTASRVVPVAGGGGGRTPKEKNQSPPPPQPRPKKCSKFSYRPDKLLTFTREALVRRGVLVQTYNCKRDKELPLKGDVVLKVNKQTPVTFYKLGVKNIISFFL